MYAMDVVCPAHVDSAAERSRPGSPDFFISSGLFDLDLLVAQGLDITAHDEAAQEIKEQRERAQKAFLESLLAGEHLSVRAGTAGRGQSLAALVDAAYQGDTSTVLSHINSDAVRISALMLRAALRGGQVETFKALEPYSPAVAIEQALEEVPQYAPANFLVYFFKSRPFSRSEREKILACACENNDLERVRVTLTQGEIFAPTDLINRVIEQSDGQDFALLDALLGELRFPGGPLSGKPSPLWVAIKKGDVRIVRYILERGANPCRCFDAAGKLVEVTALETTPAIRILLHTAIKWHQEYEEKLNAYVKSTRVQSGCCPLL
ncbi:ankyrin repeat domain-containing protein [Methylicorpusculum sp.]|uniref:ankyrin repeat domain-containing protein n=1 Tax=Methylicorpusculum sp. TaxID=2713644 RepID=UPI002ABB78DA|nr:ankyrin repeat domain-containing protein [Methylicorpusculum sp.]MDZ4154051.1 ankyrin repeat domain-containing protein [Methylicorpusculum sp.]